MLQLLSGEEVEVLVPYGKDQRDRLIAKGQFPSPVKLGTASNSKRFRFKHQIDEFLEKLARGAGGGK